MTTLCGETLRPAVINAVIDGVLEELAPATVASTADRLRWELAVVKREIARLVEGLALGGDLPGLQRDARRRQVPAKRDPLEEARAPASCTRGRSAAPAKRR